MHVSYCRMNVTYGIEGTQKMDCGRPKCYKKHKQVCCHDLECGKCKRCYKTHTQIKSVVKYLLS